MQPLCLITGGGRGIGAAIARSLGEAGFRLLINYRSSAKEAEGLAGQFPGSAAVQADVATVEGCDALYEILKKDYDGQLKVLVNNAGVALDNPLFNASVEEFQKSVAANMQSVWYLSKKLARLMIRRKEGRIINISSIVGHTGNKAQSVYGMTKAAIDNFTRSAALELADYNILVNSVAPGFIDTDMTAAIPEEYKEKILSGIPLGRMGLPDEVAQVVTFLATSGSYITGSVIHVNGGMYG
ncbi:MAG: SDR family oxidoreductase [Spirochaetales bacterium]|nr:SDR family oxidoreductase [Spirochaetales bacterium]